mmetsp:Transcript_139117/g.444370  ORF Transcript_139117/g.444370 Transcript_139117/m.444370 type:complete len:292 (-) Transcript_139117:2136-3011(-)
MQVWDLHGGSQQWQCDVRPRPWCRLVGHRGGRDLRQRQGRLPVGHRGRSWQLRQRCWYCRRSKWKLEEELLRARLQMEDATCLLATPGVAPVGPTSLALLHQFDDGPGINAVVLHAQPKRHRPRAFFELRFQCRDKTFEAVCSEIIAGEMYLPRQSIRRRVLEAQPISEELYGVVEQAALEGHEALNDNAPILQESEQLVEFLKGPARLRDVQIFEATCAVRVFRKGQTQRPAKIKRAHSATIQHGITSVWQALDVHTRRLLHQGQLPGVLHRRFRLSEVWRSGFDRRPPS